MHDKKQTLFVSAFCRQSAGQEFLDGPVVLSFEGVDLMGESLLEKHMNFRIRSILQNSSCMKEDILERHGAEDDDLIKSHPLPYKEDYSFGWKDIIEQAVEKNINDGLIFSGPDGCGKHTAAELAYYTLWKTEEENGREFEFVYLPAKVFAFSPEELNADAEERLSMIEKGTVDDYTDDIVHRFFECLFRQMPEADGVCLVIDNTDREDLKNVYDRLGQYVCISQYQGESAVIPPVFVIIIDKNDHCIPSLLRRKLLMIRMSYPTMQQRLELLKNMSVDEEIAVQLAQATENYNYAQMRDLAKNTEIYMFTSEAPSEAFYEDIVLSQMPCDTDAVDRDDSMVSPAALAARENERLTEERIQLYQRIGQLIEGLPELLEHIGTVPLAVTQTTAATAQLQRDEELSLSQINKKEQELQQHQPSEKEISDESANMEMGRLFGAVMGDERMRRIGLNRV